MNGRPVRNLSVELPSIVGVPARLGDITRSSLLEKMVAALPIPAHGGSPSICVLSGLSGIGKTCLAAAWAARNPAAYEVVFWADATNTSTVSASFQAIERWCADFWGATSPAPEVRLRVLAALAASTRPWLLILDNMSSRHEIAPWLPPGGCGHIVITTTDRTTWHGPQVSQVEVGPMTIDEATGLLTSRIESVNTGDTDRRRLQGLAESLSRWPLALELASAYLNTCLGGAEGIESYHGLMSRSLDDQDSVPVGYPTTLLQAIRLLWDRLAHTDNDGTAREAAAKALRVAAFMNSGQIPLHLVLACILFEPHEVQAAGIRGPFAVPENVLPVGEIVREMTRYGLAAVDVALPWFPEAAGSKSMSFTLSMNEIVQLVLRDHFTTEGNGPEILSRASFFLQHWVSGLTGEGGIHLAVPLASHAYQLAERCLSTETSDAHIGVLWGNTATLLAYLEDWTNAERYLRAELNWIRREAPASLLRLTAVSALIQVLISKQDWPDAFDDVLTLLAEMLSLVPAALNTKPDKALRLVDVVVTATRAIVGTGPGHARVRKIRAALQTFLPEDRADFPWSPVDPTGLIEEHLDDGWAEEAERIAARLRFAIDPRVRYEALAGLSESLAGQRRWGELAEVLDEFRAGLKEDMISSSTVALLIQNTSLKCWNYLHQPGAEWAVQALSRMADEFDRTGRVYRPADKFFVGICRALSAALLGDIGSCRLHLPEIVPEAASATTRSVALWVSMRELLIVWAGLAELEPLMAIENAPRPGPGNVGTGLTIGPSAAGREVDQLYGVLTAQTDLAGSPGRTWQCCLEVVRALLLLKHEAVVIRASCLVTLAGTVLLDLKDHSLIASLATGRIGDPTVLRLLSESTHLALDGPQAVVASCNLHTARTEMSIIRPPLGLHYTVHPELSISPQRPISPRTLKLAIRGLLWSRCAELSDDGRPRSPVG